MLRSCKYCGRIHDSKFDCGKKPIYKKNTEADKFRWTRAWKLKREEIKVRDKYLCQVCLRNLYNTVRQYNYTNLSVHHIVPIEENESRQLDNGNLITLCGYHHEKAEDGTISRAELAEMVRNKPPGGVEP